VILLGFNKGNEIGKATRFKKGVKPPSRRAKERLKITNSKQFAVDSLILDPSTGKHMTYKELCREVKRRADKYPPLYQNLLDRVMGKVQEQAPVQLQQMNIVFKSEKGKEFIEKLKAGEFKKTLETKVEPEEE
jgi:hypothetical protein